MPILTFKELKTSLFLIGLITIVVVCLRLQFDLNWGSSFMAELSSFQKISPPNSDIYILGDSRCLFAISPNEIELKTDKKVFNLCVQHQAYTPEFFKQISNLPKSTLIITLTPLSLYSGHHFGLENLKKRSFEDLLSLFFSKINFKNWSKTLLNKQLFEKGWIGGVKTANTNPMNPVNEYEHAFKNSVPLEHSLVIAEFKKIQENGYKIIFIQMPSSKNLQAVEAPHLEHFKELNKNLKAQGFKFISLDEVEGSLEYFDGDHLDRLQAKKLSKFLGAQIKKELSK